MKEFIVNGHKLAKVECGIPPRICPVYCKVLADKANSGKISLIINCDNSLNVVFDVTMLGKVRDLKADIMNQCMECNVERR